jgi:hypothetical protein
VSARHSPERATPYEGAIQTALGMGATTVMAKPVDVEGWKALVRQIWDFGTSTRQAAV